jgi:hypothetical protein
MRSQRKPHTGVAHLIQPRSPDAWNVATVGQRATASAATLIAGVIGSCRWMMSNCSRSSAARTRKNARGLSTMLGSDPFAGTITDRPTGMTSEGGSSCLPRRGCSARVNEPGGSFPMIVFTSTPSPRSASAWSSACSFTAPQNDQEYGTTIPTFIADQDRG